MDLALQQVTVRLGGQDILRNLTLEIRDRELFFILGPSGSGKTTLLRLLAGFLQPESGEVRFGNRRVNDTPAHQRQAAMVFQSPALWPHLTVEANVAYGLEVRRIPPPERRQRLDRILTLTRLEKFAERLPGELSGGQQQRVALARALVIQPDVLLLDEPLSNLDRPLREELREELRRIHQETQVTMVYVSHDSQEALALADRAAVLHQGQILQLGRPEELFLHPANRFVGDFFGPMNWIAGAAQAIGSSQLQVETELATFLADVTPPAPTGPVWLGFRPRHVQTTAQTVNRFLASPIHHRCAGEYDEWVMRTPAGITVRIHRCTSIPPVADSGWSPWMVSPQDLVVLPRR